MEADRAALTEALLQAGLFLSVGQQEDGHVDEIATKREQLKQRKGPKRSKR